LKTTRRFWGRKGQKISYSLKRNLKKREVGGQFRHGEYRLQVIVNRTYVVMGRSLEGETKISSRTERN